VALGWFDGAGITRRLQPTAILLNPIRGSAWHFVLRIAIKHRHFAWVNDQGGPLLVVLVEVSEFGGLAGHALSAPFTCSNAGVVNVWSALHHKVLDRNSNRRIISTHGVLSTPASRLNGRPTCTP
jgi:hypothetical protein